MAATFTRKKNPMDKILQRLRHSSFWLVPVLAVALVALPAGAGEQPKASGSPATQLEPPKQTVAASRGKIKTVIRPDHIVSSAVFSPDGKHIAARGTLSPRISIWEVETGRLVRELKGHPAGQMRLRIVRTGNIWLQEGDLSGVLKRRSASMSGMPRPGSLCIGCKGLFSLSVPMM